MEDPAHELRKGGGGVVLPALLAFLKLPSVISSFLTQNREEGRGAKPRSVS